MIKQAFNDQHNIPTTRHPERSEGSLRASSRSLASLEMTWGGTDQHTILIPFIMAGCPTPASTVEAIHAMAKAGAGIIELGVPFSDPVADGPVNQHAAEVALAHGMTLAKVIAIVKRVRAEGCQVPIILFSYYNPILAFGEEQFILEAKQAGVNGVLIVDLPPEEGKAFYTQLNQHDIGVVLLASPTTDPKRFALYRDLDPAFIYYISRLSVTGVQTELATGLASEVTQLRGHFPETKIAVGFGISTPEQAATVAKFADGVVVGSLLVKLLEEKGIEALARTVKQFVGVLK
ncbi:MAG: tryptophan synthase subunit alpha [Gammaproteobacteria bacterium]|nr:tryptophan synthase subunit alpha [Gammaproteobacteria bacterium]